MNSFNLHSFHVCPTNLDDTVDINWTCLGEFSRADCDLLHKVLRQLGYRTIAF